MKFSSEFLFGISLPNFFCESLLRVSVSNLSCACRFRMFLPNWPFLMNSRCANTKSPAPLRAVIPAWCRIVGPSLGDRWVMVGSSLGHRWVMVGSWLGHRWVIPDPKTRISFRSSTVIFAFRAQSALRGVHFPAPWAQSALPG